MENPEIPDFDKGYVIFLIAAREYAISVKTLYSIINPQEAPSLENTINIGKDSLFLDNFEIPFINLYDLYNTPSAIQSNDTRIIIIQWDDHKAAFYVDKVVEFISLNLNNPGPVEFIPVSNEPLVNGKIFYNERSILIPDLDKILSVTS